MNQQFRVFAAIVCVVALAACGSPSSDIAFKPPNGWKSTPGMFGRFQMWMTGASGADRQIVMLVRGDHSTSITESESFSGARNIRDLKRDTITLCGSQKADHFTGVGESTSNPKTVRETFEGVMTTIGNSKYMAFYMRPAGMRPDVQAEAALHSLCPLK